MMTNMQPTVVKLPNIDSEEWKLRGSCRISIFPDTWFSSDKGDQARAKRLCSRCSVKTECLQYSLAHQEKWGTWGGLGQHDRRRMLGLAD